MDAMPNFVRRLEDVDGDGRFDRSTIFADKMTMPMVHCGIKVRLRRQSALHLETRYTDDDGVADRREPIVGKFGFVGNAADIHGCFMGPNGRLYWCDGRHGHRFVDADGKVRSEGRAAHLFLPAGRHRHRSPLRRRHGQSGRDRFHRNRRNARHGQPDVSKTGRLPRQLGLRRLYPRDDQQPYIAEFKRTGDLLGPVVDFGHVAVSGMTRSRNGWSSEPHPQSLYVTQFNTHKVVRVELSPVGSTFAAKVDDFWASAI